MKSLDLNGAGITCYIEPYEVFDHTSNETGTRERGMCVFIQQLIIRPGMFEQSKGPSADITVDNAALLESLIWEASFQCAAKKREVKYVGT